MIYLLKLYEEKPGLIPLPWDETRTTVGAWREAMAREGCDVRVFVNKHLVEDGADAAISEDDDVVIVVYPEGGDFFRLVLFSLLTAAIPGLPVFGLGGLGASLLRTGYLLIGSMIINALIPPRLPSADLQASPSYSFEGISNTAQYGVAVPVVYGEHRVGGNVIFLTIEGAGKTQLMHMLIALSEGEIEQVTDVMLDDQPASEPGTPIGEALDDYSTGTPFEGTGLKMAIRKGTAAQTAIRDGGEIDFDDRVAQNVFSDGGQPGIELPIVEGTIGSGDSISGTTVTDLGAEFQTDGVASGDTMQIGQGWQEAPQRPITTVVVAVVSETELRLADPRLSGKFGRYTLSYFDSNGRWKSLQGEISQADGDSINGRLLTDLGAQFQTEGVTTNRRKPILTLTPNAQTESPASEDVASVTSETVLELNSNALNGRTGKYLIFRKIVRQATKLGEDYDKAFVTLLLPRGAAYITNNGKQRPWAVEVRMEFRPIGGGAWTLFPDQVGSAGTRVINGVAQFSNDRLEAWTETFRAHGDAPMTADQYEFRFTRLSPMPTGVQNIGNTEVRLLYITEAREDSLTYPHTALLAIRAVAGSQLSGRLPVVTALVKGRKVYDPRTSTVAWSDNPALHARDVILAQLDPQGWSENTTPVQARIDDTAFETWADFCDQTIVFNGNSQKLCRSDIVFDETISTWDALRQLASVGRAFILQDGTTYSVVVDDVQPSSQLFTFGSIREGSYSVEYVPALDRAQVVEVTFMDRENWQKRTIFVPESADVYLDRPVGVDARGVTRYDQAVRHGKLHLLHSQVETRVVSFEVAYEGLTAIVGDVVDVSHDTLQLGEGGRVVAYDSGTQVLTLDKELGAAAVGWTILVRLPDDTISSRTITAVDGFDVTHDGAALSFGSEDTLDAVWTAGAAGNVVEHLRVVRIGRTEEGYVRIEGVPYDATIYSDINDDTVMPTTDAATRATKAKPVQNVFAEEVPAIDQSTERVRLIAYWQYEPPYYGAAVYIRINDGPIYRVGETSGSSYEIFPEVTVGDWVRVYVAALDARGRPLGVSDSSFDDIVIGGITESFPIPDVTGFSAARNGSIVNLRWDEVEHPLFSHYEVRRGTSWQTAVRVATLSGTVLAVDWAGATTFLIKAFDSRGEESVNAASVSVGSDGSTPAVTQDEHTTWAGTKTDASVVTISGEDMLQADATRGITDDPDAPDFVYVVTEIDALAAGRRVEVEIVPLSEDLGLSVDDLVEETNFYTRENGWSVLGSVEDMVIELFGSSNSSPSGGHTYTPLVNGGTMEHRYVSIKAEVTQGIQHKGILLEMTTRVYS